MTAMSPRASGGLRRSATSWTAGSASTSISSKNTTTDGWRAPGAGPPPRADCLRGGGEPQQRDVVDPGVAERFRDLALGDPDRESLDDRGLAQPAGPMSAGLRFVRRSSTPMSASISRSRPTMEPAGRRGQARRDRGPAGPAWGWRRPASTRRRSRPRRPARRRSSGPPRWPRRSPRQQVQRLVREPAFRMCASATGAGRRGRRRSP